ncbi:hypothetical protein ACFCVW_29265 [Bacillus mobilis]|uniref:hypothetical protein n=1 Tax=Bacillus mobilis TaxID=2026190 RepID=UPI0035DE8014
MKRKGIFRIKKHRKTIILHFFIHTKYKEKKLEELAGKYDMFVDIYKKYKKCASKFANELANTHTKQTEN